MRLLLLLGLVLMAQERSAGGSAKALVDITLCDSRAIALSPPDAQFTSVSRFAVDERGKPVEITTILGANLINTRSLAACLGDWRFVGLDPFAKYTVSFEWKYGSWTEAVISGPSFLYRIRRNLMAASPPAKR
jgi:hypothetical protein